MAPESIRLTMKRSHHPPDISGTPPPVSTMRDNHSVPVPALPLTMSWLMSPPADVEGVPEPWVPGVSPAERRSLRRLGGLAHALLRNAPAARALELPADVALWLRAGPEPSHRIVDECRRALAGSADQTLAGLYADIVRSSNRRRLGTFFTPEREVRVLLSRWSATQEAPTHVVDVGAGVGVFTVAASVRWPKADVHAVDVNPVTLGLLAVRLACLDAGAVQACQMSNLVLGDYIEWLATSWSELTGPRLILGNPPYTRGSLLPEDDRSTLLEAAQGLAGSRASLSTIMTAASLKAIGPEDGLCLLLPAQWLDTRYARVLRNHLWEVSTTRRVELRLFRSGLFAGAQVDAVMLLVGAEGRQPGLFVAPDEEAEPREVSRLAGPPERWHSTVAGTKVTTEREPTVSLGSLARVRRGTATGANGFFVLSDEDAEALSVDVKLQLVRRLTGVGDAVDKSTFEAELKGTRQWLLVATREQRQTNSALDAYITGGEKAGLHERLLCSSRGTNHWFDLHHDLVRPDVVIGAMTKGQFKIVENLCSATITNNLYGWTWNVELDDDSRKRVLAWLRGPAGQAKLSAAAQQQGDRLLKIEPRALKELQVPASLIR